MTEAELPPRPASGPPATRIGHAERQVAIDALDLHMSAGRLDPDEYGDRVGKASVARTTADLDPLFADLPAPHATVAGTPGDSGSTSRRADGRMPTPGRMPLPLSGRGGRRNRHRREPLGGRVGEVAVGLSPFIALLLFLAAAALHFPQAWLFFLLIPIVGVIVYGRDHHDHADRKGRDGNF